MKTMLKEKKVKDTKKELGQGLFYAAIIFSITAIILLISTHVSKAEGTQVNGCTLKEIPISSGDTAWDIQKELAPHQDVNELLFKLKQINDSDMSQLVEGESYYFYIETNN